MFVPTPSARCLPHPPSWSDPSSLPVAPRRRKPEALLPLNPVEAAQEEGDPSFSSFSPGPEEGDQDQDRQGSAPPVPPSLLEQPPADAGASTTPESFSSAGHETGDGAAAAADTVSVGGVEETKGGEWVDEAGGGARTETGGASGAGEEEAGDEGVRSRSEVGGQIQQGNNGAGLKGGGEEAAGGGEELAYGARGGPPAVDPESTRHQGSAVPTPVLEPPHVNGGGAFPSQAAAAAVPVPTGVEKREMDSSPVNATGGGAAAAAAAPVPPAAAAPPPPTTTTVTEPHLKTGGQPLTHGNRAESPTGMSTDLQDKLKALKLRRKHRFVTMRIEGTEVVAETVAAPGEGPAELRAALPYSDCRYAVYDQEIVTADGRKANKLFFFTWLPHNATPHNKVRSEEGRGDVAVCAVIGGRVAPVRGIAYSAAVVPLVHFEGHEGGALLEAGRAFSKI